LKTQESEEPLQPTRFERDRQNLQFEHNNRASIGRCVWNQYLRSCNYKFYIN